MACYNCYNEALYPQAEFYPNNMVINKKLMLRPGNYLKNPQNITEHFAYLVCLIIITGNVGTIFSSMSSGTTQLMESPGWGPLGTEEGVLPK